MDAVPLRIPIGIITGVPDISRGILYLVPNIITPSFQDVVIPLIAANPCESGPLLYAKVHHDEIFL
jgi:hypothetical protein